MDFRMMLVWGVRLGSLDPSLWQHLKLGAFLEICGGCLLLGPGRPFQTASKWQERCRSSGPIVTWDLMADWANESTQLANKQNRWDAIR